MNRMVMAGALLIGCATAGTRDDDAVVPTTTAAAKAKGAPVLAPKVLEVPISAEARLDPVGEGQAVGAGRFVVDRGVVTLDLVVNHVPGGAHSVAIQDTCDSEHWNPTNAQHGRFDVTPFHLGDVGNFFADDNGRGSITFATELWSVGTGLSNDVVGKVIAVREKKDDFATQPIGGAGKLLGCGRIELSQMTQPAVSMTGRLWEDK